MSILFFALDLKYGYYQILMRETDAHKTKVGTTSGMLRKWLVMPQGLRTHLLYSSSISRRDPSALCLRAPLL